MWALFVEDKQISRPFRTEDEAWHLARKAGLCDGNELAENYEIRPIARTKEPA